MQRSSSQRGVTLKGILAVMVLLAGLAWIMFPTFSCGCGRSAKGRFVYCASNEKQIGLAVLQYAQDNDQLPPDGQQGTGIGWAGQVYPYVKSQTVFVCPDDGSRTADTVSYGYNSNLAALSNTRGEAMTALGTLEATVMAFEVSHDRADVTKMDEDRAQGATTFSAAGNGLSGDLHSRKSGPDPVRYARARHRPGFANYLFADGHVKAFKFQALTGEPPTDRDLTYTVP